MKPFRKGKRKKSKTHRAASKLWSFKKGSMYAEALLRIVEVEGVWASLNGSEALFVVVREKLAKRQPSGQSFSLSLPSFSFEGEEEGVSLAQQRLNKASRWKVCKRRQTEALDCSVKPTNTTEGEEEEEVDEAEEERRPLEASQRSWSLLVRLAWP